VVEILTETTTLKLIQM